MRCQACDQEMSAGMRFCTWCGTPLPAAAGARPAPATGAPPTAPNMAAPARAMSAAAPYAPAQPQAQTMPFAPAQTARAPLPSGYAPGAYPAAPAGTYPEGTHPMAPPGAAAGYAPYGYAAVPQIVNNINVTTVAPPGPAMVVMAGQDSGPNLLVRALWFLFIGLWLGPLWLVVAWLLLLTVIGLPLGLLMINRFPQVMTLKPLRKRTTVTMQNGVMIVGQSRPPQYPFLARALYFLLAGWWFSLVWLVLTYVLIVGTLGLGLPLAFWMCDQVPAVTTLARQ